MFAFTPVHRSGSARRWRALVAVATAAAWLAGCTSPPQAGGAAAAGDKTAASSPSAGRQPEVRLGIYPVIDNLPFLVARDEGMFRQEGAEVRLENFKSALDRDSAFQAAAIDAAVADPVALLSMAAAGVPVQTVGVALGVKPEEGVFAILAGPGSPVQTVDDLRNTPIAVSTNSIIEYTTDQLLLLHGFRPEEIRKTAVNDIALRYQMLMSGQVPAANLPDPLLTLAETKGARRILDDAHDAGGANLSQSLIVFRRDVLDGQPDAVRAVLRAYVRAVDAVNAGGERYRSLLVRELKLPEGLDAYRVPTFSHPVLPKPADILRVREWLAQRATLRSLPEYDQVVRDGFLP
ncbi:MAG: ABC transporter substrate-binding protein [Clostridia bacterium]|nr:ABC transporter substrate-binding protein [Clostridia bacterium]